MHISALLFLRFSQGSSSSTLTKWLTCFLDFLEKRCPNIRLPCFSFWLFHGYQLFWSSVHGCSGKAIQLLTDITTLRVFKDVYYQKALHYKHRIHIF